MNRIRRTFLIAILSVGLWAVDQGIYAQAPATQSSQPVRATKAESFFRTELYFGRSKPNGGLVSDDDWKAFLVDTVTPRFSDGFTALKAIGQYREKSGRIISEPSEVLIFYYSKRSKNQSRTKIEEIRAAYIKRFEQESVLRVDLPKSVRVSF